MSLTSCLHMILLLCTLCIPCEAAVGYIACTIINDSNCTKYGNAICDTNKCRCVNSYYDDGSTCQKKRGRRRRVAEILPDCYIEQRSAGERCNCNVYEYWTGSICAPKKKVNAACTANIVCIFPMTCSSGSCQCSKNQYWTEFNCAERKGVGETCYTDNECLSPMTCADGACKCPTNQYWTGSSCTARKGVGVTCNTDNECLSPMTCADGACKCPTNQYWTGSSCTAQKNVNAACTADRECISPLTCSSGRCQCSSNQFWTVSNCIARKGVGETCNTDNECLSPMTCADGACKCPTNQYWTGSSCTAQKNVNAACTADRECISPLTCSSGRCQCSSNQFWTGSNCIAKKNVNAACTADSQCFSPMACSSGRCQCSTNQYWTGSNCIAQKDFNAACNADLECFSPMTCSSGNCQCSTSQYWTGSNCVALSSVPTSVMLGMTSRSIQISWRKPVDSKGTILGYRLRVLLNNDCRVEVLLVCSTWCSNERIQHLCTADKRLIRENRSNTDLMSSMSYEINQLLPYTYYDVWINAINAAGDGNRSETPIETDSEVPQKPFDVIASVASSSEITVTWKQPKPRPGVTTYYVKVFEVVQNAKPVFLKIANVTGFGTQTAHFTGLEAYLNYTFSVVAATDKGNSEQSDMSAAITTKQDTQSLVSLKGYTIQTVVGAAIGCVIFGGLVVGLLFYLIRRKNINSKQSRRKQTPEESQIGGQYEEI